MNEKRRRRQRICAGCKQTFKIRGDSKKYNAHIMDIIKSLRVVKT